MVIIEHNFYDRKESFQQERFFQASLINFTLMVTMIASRSVKFTAIKLTKIMDPTLMV